MNARFYIVLLIVASVIAIVLTLVGLTMFAVAAGPIPAGLVTLFLVIVISLSLSKQ